MKKISIEIKNRYIDWFFRQPKCYELIPHYYHWIHDEGERRARLFDITIESLEKYKPMISSLRKNKKFDPTSNPHVFVKPGKIPNSSINNIFLELQSMNAKDRKLFDSTIKKALRKYSEM